ncbi:MAG: hypothetical protein ACLTDF_00135 [Coprococcus sp.]
MLSGRRRSDKLDGGAGNDKLYGGAGTILMCSTKDTELYYYDQDGRINSLEQCDLDIGYHSVRLERKLKLNLFRRRTCS